MRRLNVFIEFNGCSIFAGELTGNDSGDVCFIYADSYLSNPEFHSISISLPKTEKTFDAVRTRIFFEGLLPESFIEKTQPDAGGADSEENSEHDRSSGGGIRSAGSRTVLAPAIHIPTVHIRPDFRAA